MWTLEATKSSNYILCVWKTVFHFWFSMAENFIHKILPKCDKRRGILGKQQPESFIHKDCSYNGIQFKNSTKPVLSGSYLDPLTFHLEKYLLTASRLPPPLKMNAYSLQNSVMTSLKLKERMPKKYLFLKSCVSNINDAFCLFQIQSLTDVFLTKLNWKKVSHPSLLLNSGQDAASEWPHPACYCQVQMFKRWGTFYIFLLPFTLILVTACSCDSAYTSWRKTIAWRNFL